MIIRCIKIKTRSKKQELKQFIFLLEIIPTDLTAIFHKGDKT